MMTNSLIIQQDIAAAPTAVFAALSDSAALQRWFAEAADISLPEMRYDFWGKFTPETPVQAAGKHPILAAEADALLRFGWTLLGLETAVSYHLKPHNGQTRMRLEWSLLQSVAEGEPNPLGMEDFWFLSCENLRRYIDGRSVVRCDFTMIKPGDIELSIDIEGSAEAVYDVLINPAQLERWIASKAKVEPEVGGLYDFGWGMEGAVKIIELTPNKSLSVRWSAWGDTPPTVVTWTLAESQGKTRLTLVHSGFRPDQEAGEWLGWLNFLTRIQSIVEVGDSWKAAVHPVPEEMRNFYAAAILESQDELT